MKNYFNTKRITLKQVALKHQCHLCINFSVSFLYAILELCSSFDKLYFHSFSKKIFIFLKNYIIMHLIWLKFVCLDVCITCLLSLLIGKKLDLRIKARIFLGFKPNTCVYDLQSHMLMFLRMLSFIKINLLRKIGILCILFYLFIIVMKLNWLVIFLKKLIVTLRFLVIKMLMKMRQEILDNINHVIDQFVLLRSTKIKVILHISMIFRLLFPFVTVTIKSNIPLCFLYLLLDFHLPLSSLFSQMMLIPS